MTKIRCFLLTILAAIGGTAAAQHDDGASQNVVADTVGVDNAAGIVAAEPALGDAPAETFALPIFDLSAPGFDGVSPCRYGLDGASWRLHEGFNAQLGMSLTAGFGKGAPRGVGFGQNAAFAYAMPLSKRFAAAVGVYAANMDWGGFRQTDGGVAAAVRYRVSDAVNLYAYGAKSFFPDNNSRRGGPFPLFLYTPSERIGAMAEFKFGRNVMFQVSVEKQRY